MKKFLTIIFFLCLPLVFIYLNVANILIDGVNIAPYLSISLGILLSAGGFYAMDVNITSKETKPLRGPISPEPSRNMYLRHIAYNLFNGEKALHSGANSYDGNDMLVAIKSAEFYIKKAKENLIAYNKSISDSPTIEEPLCRILNH